MPAIEYLDKILVEGFRDIDYSIFKGLKAGDRVKVDGDIDAELYPYKDNSLFKVYPPTHVRRYLVKYSDGKVKPISAHRLTPTGRSMNEATSTMVDLVKRNPNFVADFIQAIVKNENAWDSAVQAASHMDMEFIEGIKLASVE